MKKLLVAIFVTSTAWGPATSFAAEADIKYRQATMKAIGGHMGAMGSIVKGEVPHKDDLPYHVAAMGSLADMAGHLFPEGSLGAKSKAKKEIWEQPDKFEEAMGKFRTATEDLVAADTEDAEAFKTAFEALGKACKGCHEDFRKKQKK